MRITIIHPAIGHRRAENYIRSWQMEPLPAAAIAGLTPADIDIRFYDDRMESIPFEERTDTVVMSIETYTAKRAYQIASDYRRRGVPVILGGFHATLVPEEAELYAEAVVIGEAEAVWAEVIDDLRHGTLKKRYQSLERPALSLLRVNRSIFRGKRYLPIGLIETGRGCRFSCEFCAIQSFFQRSHRQRPIDGIIEELLSIRDRAKVFFFVDDNFAGDLRAAKDLLRSLIPLKFRWITQMSINAAHDEEFLTLLVHAGCKGVLIGFESLDEANLKLMCKRFNTMKGGYTKALENLQRHRIRIYATFIFGYDHDTEASFDRAVEFANDNRFYIAAFNHLTPFPGTPLYERLRQHRALRYPAWWLDDRYRYNQVPFRPMQLTPGDVTRLCVAARRRFYSLPSILSRSLGVSNRSDLFMLAQYFPINLLHRGEISLRNGYPLGDERWTGTLLEASV
jgi:radical SAM superfamily enzyme YgiQ (UPF0313 family)